MKKFYFLLIGLSLLIVQKGLAQQFWTGTGTWNTTNANWSNTSATPSYTNIWTSGLATFQGTAGTVTVAPTAPSATGLTFTQTGYILSGTSLLTLTGIPTITIGSGTTANTTEFDGPLSASGIVTIISGTTKSATINFGPVTAAAGNPFALTNFSGGITVSTGISRINGNNLNAFGTSGNAGPITVHPNNLTISNVSGEQGGTSGADTIFNTIKLNPDNISAYYISFGGTKPGTTSVPTPPAFLLNYRGAIIEGGSGTSNVSLGNTPATGSGGPQGSGTCMFSSNANTYKGQTIFNSSSGYFQCGIDNCLPQSNQFVFGDGTGVYGLFDLNGHNLKVGSIETNGAVSTSKGITNSGASVDTITISGGGTSNANATFATTIGANNISVGSTTITGTNNIALTLAPGAGTLTLTAVNTFTGGLKISGGTLQMGKGNAIGSGGSLPLTLDGGTFSSGATTGFSQNLGTLNETNNNSIITLGTGSHSLTFAASGGLSWGSGTVTINGWVNAGGIYNGTTGDGGQIFFPDATSASLTTAQLSQIFFNKAGVLYPAILITTGSQGELVPAAITTPVLATSTPTSLTFAEQAVGTNSTTVQSFTLNGTNLKSFPSNITVNAPTDFQVSADGVSWASSFNIPYTSATLAATTIYVRFSPLSGGFKSENITFTGGNTSGTNVPTPPVFTVNGAAQATYTSIASGNWSSSATWQGGNIPQGGADIIVISNGNTVALDESDTSISSLTINGTLNLTSNSNSLQVQTAGGSDLTVLNGTLDLGSALTTTGLFTSTTLTVDNGAVFTNSAGNALAVSIANFNVNNGGTYNHDATGSIALGATTDFPGSSSISLGNSSNVVITKWGQNGGSGPNQLPATTYGNLTLNVGTTLTGKWGQSAHITTINGTFTVIKTGTSATFYFVKSQTLPVITIGGDLDISGGYVGTANSTTFPILNIGGNVNITGGTLDLDGDTTTLASDAGNVVVNIAGNFSVSGTGTVVRTGGSTALAQVNFNKPSGIQTFSSTAGGINSNKVSWYVGDGTTTNSLQLNSDFIMSNKSVLTVNSNNSIICGTNVAIDSSLALLGLSTVNLNGQTLTLNLNAPLSATNASGSFTGSSTSGLTIGGTSAGGGTFNFTSGSQILQTLLCNGNSDDTLGTHLDITAGSAAGTVTVNAGSILKTQGNLTIKSDANGTAQVANSAGTISGNVVVERYIPANSERAWRLLSVPTSGQTINAAWQEGQTGETNTVPGYGTIITASTNNSNWAADGFDAQQIKSSILTYGQSANTWNEVPSTYDPIATNSGYFLYIRGDRSQDPASTAAPTTATTLRSTGSLYQGTQTAISVPAGEFGLIGNIYASTIDFTTIAKGSGIDDKFYAWDPKLLNQPPSLGAYVTFSSVNNWVPVPGVSGVGSYGNTANSLIESGQAFFVHASSTDVITLAENNKVSGSAEVFRPASPESVSGKLTTNLYEVNGSTNSLADGNVEVFNTAYPDTIDGYDALKLSNTMENFGILRDGKVLVIEARQPVTTNDTIYFDMWNMKQQQYNLQFIPTDLNTENLTAYLQDSYLRTNTPISLSDTSNVSFTIDTNAASSINNRFQVVFNSSSPLPVTFTSITANRQNATSPVIVSWTVAGENGIKDYSVQRSTDGINFSEIGTAAAKNNNGGNAAYSFTDAQALNSAYYYRVESIGISGATAYTSIVKVSGTDETPAITIYPNPVINRNITVKLTNELQGAYKIKLLNADGQSVYETIINHNGGNGNYILNLPAIAAGAYKLEIVSQESNTNYSQEVIVE